MEGRWGGWVLEASEAFRAQLTLFRAQLTLFRAQLTLFRAQSTLNTSSQTPTLGTPANFPMKSQRPSRVFATFLFLNFEVELRVVFCCYKLNMASHGGK